METMNRHEDDKPVRKVEGVRLTRQQCGWQSEKLPIHGCRVVDNTGRLIAADVYDEEVANRIVADHNNAADYQASLRRITATRNRYWEQVEMLVEALRNVRAKFFEDASAGGYVERGEFISFGDEQHPWIPGAKASETIAIIDAALAAVAEESEK